MRPRTLGRKKDLPTYSGCRAGGDGDLTSSGSLPEAQGRGQGAHVEVEPRPPPSRPPPPSPGPVFLAMAALTAPQPQPRPGAGGLRLSSATSRLGDLHKPLVSAFPSVSWDGVNNIG